MEEISASILLERVLHDAMERRASDVHLHVVAKSLEVEFRVFGRLVPYVSIPGHGDALVRRVKALSRVDVAETRFPQDGSFRYESEAFVADVRVASVPTVHGESVVLRLLPLRAAEVSFTSLGMTDDQSATIFRMLGSKSGLILVAGPTGAGKTTTMYAMMTQLARWGKRVLSIEDPVEARLHGCQQMEVRERLGLTFDAGLKALLRQDPDVLMIGEIRDATTAQVVLRASMSGHVVLSTTHATDLVGAATRLVDFGLSRPLLSEILRGVVVQHMDARMGIPSGELQSNNIALDSPTSDHHPFFSIYEVTPQLAALLGSSLPWSSVRSAVTKTAGFTTLPARRSK